VDLTDGPIQGSKVWRFTPTVNRHMSNNVRLELVDRRLDRRHASAAACDRFRP